jgi:hypothetical protein
VVKTLYYALGGGLGHLTRARSVLRTLGVEATILTAAVHDRRVTGASPVLRVTRPEDIQPAIDAFEPDRVIVDTFPAGLFGELGPMHIDYVARYLRWDKYLDSVPRFEPKIDNVYVLEPLEPGHEKFLRMECGVLAPLFLPDRKAAASRRTPRYTLIVHSGPASEIEELIAYAKDVCREEAVEAPIVVCAPRAMHDESLGVRFVDEYPATELARSAARIFTAGGFNAMNEFGGDDRHRPLPFPRKFDDQFRRVARVRSSFPAFFSNVWSRSRLHQGLHTSEKKAGKEDLTPSRRASSAAVA